MAKRSPSILNRIVLLHLLALAAISVAISAAAYLLLNSTVNDFEEQVLRGHAQTVVQYLSFRNDAWRLNLPPDLLSIYERGFDGYALAVVEPHGKVVYSSLPNAATLARVENESPGLFRVQQGSSTYYGLLVPVTMARQNVWIEVGQKLQNPDVIVDDIVANFLGRIAWIAIGIFAILFVIDTLLMRRLLAPIVAASHVAGTISPTQSSKRLPLGGLPREVLPLALAVNTALERLEKALQAQREFTADAAHELRTPLTILRTHVDTMLDGNVAEAMRGDIDSMSHMVDQLLALAELEGLPDWKERVDLAGIAANVVAAMAPIALAQSKSLELNCATPAIVACGHGEMLYRALRNLIENAIRYAPAGTSIEVAVDLPATLSVRDRGLGIPAPDRDMIFRRFWRRNRQDRDHSGLGLAIVAKIVQIHDGSIVVRDRPGGGTEFAITLP